MMTTAEASEALGISPITVRRAFREGRLTGRRIGPLILVTRSSVERYRRLHLGRMGRIARVCVECGVPRRDHANSGHRYRRDPRL